MTRSVGQVVGVRAGVAVPRFGAFADAAIAHLAAGGLRAEADYRDLLRLRLAPYLERKLLSEVTRLDGAKIHQDMAMFGLRPRTRRNALRLLHQLMGAAVVAGHIKANPIVVPRGLDVDGDPTWREGARYTTREVALLVQDERIDEIHRAAFELQYGMGLRASELGGADFGHLSLSRPHMPGLRVIAAYNRRARAVQEPKCLQRRMVPIRPHFMRAIERLRTEIYPRRVGRAARDDDPIIPVLCRGQLGRLRCDTAWHWLEEACAIVGIRRRGTHSLRATTISLLEEAGVPEALIKQIVHNPPSSHTRDVLRGYTRPLWKKLYRAMRAVRLPEPDRQLSLPFT